MAATEGNTVAFVIFAAAMCVFSYKACKSFLVNALSALPWPVFLVLTMVLSCLVGVVVAPYYIGKWIGEKVSGYLEE